MRSAIRCIVALTLALTLALSLAGCVTATYGDITYTSFFKDINATGQASIAKDGTRSYKFDVTSNVDSALIKSVAEGTAAGVVRGVVKP